MKKALTAILTSSFAACALASSIPQEGDIFGAIANNDIALLEAFIEQNPACATTPSEGGISPLHYAAQKGSIEAIYQLIRHGADVNAVAKSSQTTPLHWATQANHPDAVKLLVKNNADFHARAVNGFNVLHFCARADGDTSGLISFFAGKNVDVNATEKKYGDTPLHTAARLNHAEAVRALLAANADISRKNNEGKFASDLTTDDVLRKLLAPPVIEVPAPVPTPEPAPTAVPAAAVPAPAAEASAPAPDPGTVVDPEPADIASFADSRISPVERYQKVLRHSRTVRMPDGSLYLGEWKRNKFDGTGLLMILATGREFYYGSFRKGKMHGPGTYHFNNGSVLSCVFKNGAPDGEGTFKTPNGTFIQGIWKKGLFRDGTGTFKDSHGNPFQAVWKQGLIVSQVPLNP